MRRLWARCWSIPSTGLCTGMYTWWCSSDVFYSPCRPDLAPVPHIASRCSRHSYNTTASRSFSTACTTTKMQCRGEVECLDLLRRLGVSVDNVIVHDRVTTVDEWAPIAAKAQPTAAVAKNLFLKGKKDEMVLVVAMASSKTDIKVIGKATECSSLRFAPEDVLNKVLGVIQGAVTPLALVNDTAKVVTVVLDTALLAFQHHIAFHPCRNDRTVFLKPSDLVAYLAELGYAYKKVDFAAAATAEPEADGAAVPKQQQQRHHHPAPAAPEKKVTTDDASGATKLGLDVKKLENFPEWYAQVITKSEMLEYYEVSGCYILRPWSFAIWEHITAFFDREIKLLGVENCQFPMFVSKAALEKEKDHVEGFAPEVAWVTRAGTEDLAEPVALRPTSETVMYPAFAKWIRSHRDLPLRLNQWCNVVRWEFSHPTPFIRTREFLWQEGHSAFATKQEAEREVMDILDLYRRVYTDMLAIPCVPGRKTEKEKFAGGDYTTSVETFIDAVGRGCQGATSHHLGQNFGRMFGLEFEDPNRGDGSKCIPYQNSWGLTTRTIGVMVMVHGDDKGLVLPPRVAQVQVVIVPVGLNAKATEAQRREISDAATAIETSLRRVGIRCRADLRENYTSGWKFNHWELKGVPLRIDIGPVELKSKKLTATVRYNRTKIDIFLNDDVGAQVNRVLEDIHSGMLAKATALRDERQVTLTSWPDFVPALNRKCTVLAPWCGSMSCEEAVKKESAEESKALMEGVREDERAPSMGAKSLNIPFDQPPLPVGTTCICKSCNAPATTWVLWGRSY